MPRFQTRIRYRGVRLALVFAAMVIGALYAWWGAPPAAVSGRVTVVDGDTLKLGFDRIRLLGIDAPELKQNCTDADGASWACGQAAKQRMELLTQGASVDCKTHGRDRYRRILAACLANGIDIGGAMIGYGLAVADGNYFDAEAKARDAKTGIWGGSFIPPAQWRRNGGQEDDGGPLAAIRDLFR